MTAKQLLLGAVTIRHLRPRQVIWRVYFASVGRIRWPSVRGSTAQLRRIRLITVIARPESWLGNGFRFLRKEVIFSTRHSRKIIRFTGEPNGLHGAEDGGDTPNINEQMSRIQWHPDDVSKLWAYNLHYFDYLQQPQLDTREALGLIADWTDRNPCCSGDGWEPYPISMRIVNWVKFLLRAGLRPDIEARIATSLYQQAQRLRQNIEYHLLGNHLFKNGVALFLAGNLFEGKEPREWCRKGKRILDEQIAEQILPDGGHFERSPMYHAIVLEDVLDCLNLASASEQEDPRFEGLLRQTAEGMLRFLSDIVHVDGGLPRFNDTAEGVAPTLGQLSAYALRLGLQVPPKPQSSGVLEKPYFGLYVLMKGPWRCIVDGGAIGPDYQPGHAHCDTLSYELTLSGRPIAVNAGLFEYAGPERGLYRSTRSHNTVEIDGEEQHEIWSTFRVARRGYPLNVAVWYSGEAAYFSGGHTGYQRLPGKPIHQREIALRESGVTVHDRVLSRRVHRVRSFVHLHPSVQVCACWETGATLSVEGETLILKVNSGRLSIEDYRFSPEFGLQEPAKVLVVADQGGVCPMVKYTLQV